MVEMVRPGARTLKEINERWILVISYLRQWQIIWDNITTTMSPVSGHATRLSNHGEDSDSAREYINS